MLDLANEQLIAVDKSPIAFDHDCREGICGTCSLVINGIPHGPEAETTTCQLHMRKFKDGATITVEPYRCKPFPVIKDLVVDRSAMDKVLQAGGYISVRTGSAPDGNALPIAKPVADKAMDARGLYRLWSLCGSLSKRIGDAFYGGQNFSPQHAPSRRGRERSSFPCHGHCDGRSRLRKLH